MSRMACDNPRCPNYVPHDQHPDAMRVSVQSVPTFVRIDPKKPITAKADFRVVTRIQHRTAFNTLAYLCEACDGAVQMVIRGRVL